MTKRENPPNPLYKGGTVRIEVRPQEPPQDFGVPPSPMDRCGVWA